MISKCVHVHKICFGTNRRILSRPIFYRILSFLNNFTIPWLIALIAQKLRSPSLIRMRLNFAKYEDALSEPNTVKRGKSSRSNQFACDRVGKM